MFSDVMNLDSSVAFDQYRHLVQVLEGHCEKVGRDPAEIKHTLKMAVVITEDQKTIDLWVERSGPGTLVGPRDSIIERIGEFKDAGVDTIMFFDMATCAVMWNADHSPADVLASVQRLDEEIIALFN